MRAVIDEAIAEIRRLQAECTRLMPHQFSPRLTPDQITENWAFTEPYFRRCREIRDSIADLEETKAMVLQLGTELRQIREQHKAEREAWKAHCARVGLREHSKEAHALYPVENQDRVWEIERSIADLGYERWDMTAVSNVITLAGGGQTLGPPPADAIVVGEGLWPDRYVRIPKPSES